MSPCKCDRISKCPARYSGGPAEETGDYDCYECREDAIEAAYQHSHDVVARHLLEGLVDDERN